MSTNRFPTICTDCRRSIDAGKGTLTGKVAGRWTAVHTGTCDQSLAPVATTVADRQADYFRTVLREAEGRVDLAWLLILEHNEHFDGEDEIAAEAKRNFLRWVAGSRTRSWAA